MTSAPGNYTCNRYTLSKSTCYREIARDWADSLRHRAISAADRSGVRRPAHAQGHRIAWLCAREDAEAARRAVRAPDGNRVRRSRASAGRRPSRGFAGASNDGTWRRATSLLRVDRPRTATIGATPPNCPAMPSADRTCSARLSATKFALVTTTSTAPRRCSARSRRLERTEAPTRSAPARTATATPTPVTTARFVCQKWARLRRTNAASVTTTPAGADRSGDSEWRSDPPASGCASRPAARSVGPGAARGGAT